MPDEAAPVATPPMPPSLLRSGAFSLVTSAAPLVVALLALPLLTRQLGSERLGLLALAWAWLGYATLLDFGLGRALTRIVAGAETDVTTPRELAEMVATAHWLLTVVGGFVGVAGALMAPWYVRDVLEVSDSLQADAILSAVIFALTVPAVTGASIPRAVLEAHQQFRVVNLIRLPVSVGTFAVPLLLLSFTTSLSVIAATMAVLRVSAWWQYARRARVTLPQSDAAKPGTRHLHPLLRAGAWMTVSNVLSPLLTVADRFLIGSAVSVSAVALYAVPWEAVTKLWIIPGAVTMVFFPAVSRAAKGGAGALSPLYSAGSRLVALLVIPACALAALFAPWLLQLAGGTEYMGSSVIVLRFLCVGVAANCIGVIPFSLLQASGRARWTAMLHLMEIVPYVALLWIAVHRWGIVGAAAVWTLRTLADTALLAWRAQPVAPLSATSHWGNVLGVSVVAACGWIGTVSTGGARGPLAAAALISLLVPFVLWSQRTEAERLVLGTVGRRA